MGLNRIIGLAALLWAASAQANDRRAGGKLLLTDGISSIEGAAGGGIASWALIAGNETDAGIGGSAHATIVALPDFTLRSYGAAVGVFDRVELSWTRQAFDTGAAGAKLGLGRGFAFGQDIYGAKLRVAGDAIWDQDRWMPQIAIGVQHKRARKGDIIRAIGGRQASGTDFTIAATKLFLARGLLVNGTMRWTRANQLGLLGFGGDAGRRRRLQVEGSVALMLSPAIVVGGEYRTKPDNLGFARETDAVDLFAAWAVHRNLTLTAAYADLGPIATFGRQRGMFAQMQAAF